MRLRTVLLSASLAPLAALPAPAHAVAIPQQAVSYGGGFLPSEIKLVAGNTLLLTNADPTLSHDLRSLDTVGGKPRFTSKILAPGEQGEVVGVSSIEVGDRVPFVCSVHDAMTGNLEVV